MGLPAWAAASPQRRPALPAPEAARAEPRTPGAIPVGPAPVASTARAASQIAARAAAGSRPACELGSGAATRAEPTRVGGSALVAPTRGQHSPTERRSRLLPAD